MEPQETENTSSSPAPEEATTPPTEGLPEAKIDALTTTEEWEVRIAKTFVYFLFIGVAGSFLLSIYISIFRGATAPPKVWKATMQRSQGEQTMRPSKVRRCVQQLEALDHEQQRETQAVWSRMRQGHRGNLTLWQEWSRNWRKRMKGLLTQCPMALDAKDSKSKPLVPKRLSQCVGEVQQLSKALQKRADALWLKTPRGQSRDMDRWKDWSGDWQRRMRGLIKRCPLYHKGDVAQAFHRASTQMLRLQQEQEKALLIFFRKSSDLFRDIRQSMHSLKQELR